MLEFAGQAVNDLSLGSLIEVDAVAGACTLTIPIPVTGARDGMEPSLGLGCSSGGGNAPSGARWGLSGLPAFGIDTRYHVPLDRPTYSIGARPTIKGRQ